MDRLRTMRSELNHKASAAKTSRTNKDKADTPKVDEEKKEEEEEEIVIDGEIEMRGKVKKQ
jgi:hypothetical protein